MNFQNIPRKDKVVKRAFVPKQDVLLFFDYSQIEFVLLAYFCAKLGDNSMVDVLARGDDLHKETAIGGLGITGDEVEDWQRQLGKQINYSLIYGGAQPAIRRYADCSWERAGEILAGFHHRWPGVRMLQERINDTLDQRGYIRTPWGRHLHPRSRHSALNTLIQGSAADLLRSSMVKVHKWLQKPYDPLWVAGPMECDPGPWKWESHLVLTVHDELMVDAPEWEVPHMVAKLPKLMDYAPISKVIQIETEVEWTKTNWAEKEPYGTRS